MTDLTSSRITPSTMQSYMQTNNTVQRQNWRAQGQFNAPHTHKQTPGGNAIKNLATQTKPAVVGAQAQNPTMKLQANSAPVATSSPTAAKDDGLLGITVPILNIKI